MTTEGLGRGGGSAGMNLVLLGFLQLVGAQDPMQVN